MTDIIQAGIEIDVTGVDRGEVALKRLAQTGDQVDKSFERGAKAAKGAGDATAQAGRAADKARGSFSGFTQETKEMAAATNSLTGAVGKLGGIAAGVFGGIKLTGLIKDVTMANSRFEQMGLVMDVVGRNAGISSNQVAKYASEVQAMGISMTESRQTVIRMTQAQMDLSKASELARLAQDAAVIANTNSSDALGRLIYGLQSGQVEILRTMGLNVNFAGSYSKLAAEMGVTVDQLSEVDKVQARTNAVMEAGVQIAGAYDASMENAGKQLGSTTRYLQDLGVMWGEVFSKVGHDAIFGYSDMLKSLHERTKELRDDGTLDRLADAIGSIARGAVTGAKVLGAYAVAVYAIPAAKAAATVATTAYQAVLATFSAQVAMTTTQLLSMRTALNVLAAGFAGWEIGSYLRKEFEIVEKAGIALMSALHQWAAQIRGTFLVMGENIKFAFLNPIDAIRSAIADLVAWIAGLGTGVASAMGFDTSSWERSIADAHGKIRGANAAEHEKTIAQIKANTKKEIATISDGYASLFAEVGKSSKEATRAITGAIKPTKGLGDETESTGRKILTGANSAKELARALKELEREQAKNTKSAVDAAKALSKGNDELRREIDSIGKTKRELVAMERQRNNVTAAALKEAAATLDVSIAQDKELGTTKDLIKLKEQERDAILEQIDLIGERNRLLGERIDTEEVYESQKKIADKWQSLSDDMGRTFTDAIIQGGASAKEAIKRMFTNMVLRPIIEPIAQGVAGMFVNVLGGGQSGGLMGMLGGGSGGGGFSLGSVASMGSKIYSAFTGWGKAAVAGWNQSGVTGIFTGIWDYGTGLMSGLSGGMGAFAAGVKGAYLPAGFYGPTTAGAGGMMGLGNTVGNLGASASWMSALGGALQGYQNSGLKGAVAGGAGGYGGAKLGATAGSYFGPVGTAVGAIVGGVLGAIGGSSLFGGKWKTEDVGIGLGFDAGGFFGQEFEYQKKKGGLFSSSKKKTIWTALDEEVYDALSEAMAESVSGTKGLFEALGFEIASDALSGLETGITQISTMGKDEEKIQEEIGDWLVSTNEAVAAELHKVLGTGLDLDLEGLTDFVLNLMGVNEILGVLGLAVYESNIAGAELAQTLSGLAGGFENLAGASDVYYRNFFTAEEQFEHAFAAMEKALGDAGLSAIDSRDAYRQAVEGLDLATEAGQEMFATMMAMAGVAAEYFGIMEGYQSTLEGMRVALDAEPILGYTAVLESLQKEFEQMAKELDIVGLATEESLSTLEQFRQKMAEMAALDLFDGGQSMADALRQGLLGTWDGEAIGDYLARSISDGVYGAIAGQFANQITDILLQGIVAPMINAAMTGASISEAVSSSTISSMVAQAQAVAQVAVDVMNQLRASGVMDELQDALGDSVTMPSGSYITPTYTPIYTPTYTPPRTSTPKVDDSWERLLESIIKQTDRAQQQIVDMGRTTYEKGLADIASTVADYQAQIAQSTASKREQLTEELAAMEQAGRKLLEAQMTQKAADLLAGLADELERIGKTDAELALMDIERRTQDYIKSLQDVGRATAGNIAQVEAWSKAMKDAAAKDAQIKAASDAYDALGRAVDSQRSIITEALELARDVADAAGNAAKSLFSNVLGASDASAAQARAFISDALNVARSTGYLPDGDKLREAIDSATRGFDEAAALSVADANWQKLVLANQLKELADLAEPQVDYAQSQLDALDNMLQNAQDQLDVLQGIDNSVLTVAEALSRFNDVVGNGQIITPESPVFTPDMPPRQTAPDNSAQAANAELVAEVIELRNYMREIQRETKRTADAVNGRGDAPMLVEAV